LTLIKKGLLVLSGFENGNYHSSMYSLSSGDTTTIDWHIFIYLKFNDDDIYSGQITLNALNRVSVYFSPVLYKVEMSIKEIIVQFRPSPKTGC